MPNPILNRRCAGNPYPNTAALFVSASSQYGSITDGAGPNLSPGTGNLSVEFWAQVNTLATFQGLCGKGAYTNDAANSRGWRIGVNGGNKFQATVGDLTDTTQVAATGATSYAVGVWNHLVYTFDRAGSMTIYLNGVSDGTAVISGESASWTSTSDFVIGCRKATTGTTTQFLNGLMDSIGVWTKILSASEIAASYNNGVGRALRDVGDRTNLVAWYGLDGNLSDSSLSGYGLTNNAGITFTAGKR
jgi:hypothetical protein